MNNILPKELQTCLNCESCRERGTCGDDPVIANVKSIFSNRRKLITTNKNERCEVGCDHCIIVDSKVWCKRDHHTQPYRRLDNTIRSYAFCKSQGVVVPKENKEEVKMIKNDNIMITNTRRGLLDRITEEIKDEMVSLIASKLDVERVFSKVVAKLESDYVNVEAVASDMEDDVVEYIAKELSIEVSNALSDEDLINKKDISTIGDEMIERLENYTEVVDDDEEEPKKVKKRPY